MHATQVPNRGHFHGTFIRLFLFKIKRKVFRDWSFGMCGGLGRIDGSL